MAAVSCENIPFYKTQCVKCDATVELRPKSDSCVLKCRVKNARYFCLFFTLIVVFYLSKLAKVKVKVNVYLYSTSLRTHL